MVAMPSGYYYFEIMVWNKITVLLVEQNAFKALSIADKAYVLEQGKVTMEGLASDLIKDERIQEAYLGKKKTKVGSSSWAIAKDRRL